MTRSGFRQLTDVRVAEAKALLDAGMWDGAYYLAGYAVEFALKACIAKLTRAEDFPPRETRDYYTHDVARLRKSAGLDAARKAEAGANPTFQTYWLVAESWDEESRYARKSEVEAQDLYQAVTDPTNGALQWIRGHW